MIPVNRVQSKGICKFNLNVTYYVQFADRCYLVSNPLTTRMS